MSLYISLHVGVYTCLQFDGIFTSWLKDRSEGLIGLLIFLCGQVFKDKVLELGEKLLPAFNTPTGIPRGVINLGR